MKSLDRIIIGASTNQWLVGKGILPSTWDLSAEHQSRIVGANVGLLTMKSPGSAYMPSPGAISHQSFNGLVIIDTVAFANSSLSALEMIAAILHEFGHHVNPSPDNCFDLEMIAKGHGDEVYADKFVIECGFANAFLRALKKFEGKLDGFSNEPVRDRISRLQEASEASS